MRTFKIGTHVKVKQPFGELSVGTKGVVCSEYHKSNRKLKINIDGKIHSISRKHIRYLQRYKETPFLDWLDDRLNNV